MSGAEAARGAAGSVRRETRLFRHELDCGRRRPSRAGRGLRRRPRPLAGRGRPAPAGRRRRGPGRGPRLRAHAHGARLWLDGQVSLLIVTGGEPGPGDSATSLRDVAVALGVPPGRILLEQVSHSTREALVAVRPILAQLEARRVALVTSPYHQRRACLAARQVLKGIAIVNRPADPAGWKPEGWWKTARSRRIVLGEYVKLTYYILRGWV